MVCTTLLSNNQHQRYCKIRQNCFMFSTSKRIRIQRILNRIAKGKEGTLQERIFLEKVADHDQTISSWLKKALRLQQNQQGRDGIDHLLDDLELGSPHPESTYCPEEDDLGEWFSGAPSWLARS